MIYICVYMLRVLSEVCHTYLCECLARGMTAFFYVYIHAPNKFIYCSCKVHNNYTIMNLTVIPYILIIFLVFFFSFLRDPMLIFFLREVIFIFMFHYLRGLFGTVSHHNLCISVNVMRHQMHFLTFIC